MKQKIFDINEHYYGSEPKDPKKCSIIRALNWHNTITSNDDKVLFAKTFAKTNNIDINNVNEYYLYSIGSAIRLYENGYNIKKEYLIDKLNEIRKEHIIIVEEKPEKVKNKESNISLFYTEYDLYLDGVKTKISISDKLSVKDNKELIEYYTKQKADLIENADGYSKSKIVKLNKCYDDILADIKKHGITQKIIKSRKKKIVPKSKVVEKVLYQKDYSELNLISINPETIIGAELFLAYNVKTRQIQYYYGLNGGLSFKGSTLQNFDEEKSFGKTLRQPQTMLSELSSTKRKSLTVIDKVKSVKKKLTGRINRDTILLRVF